ncbi:Rhodanese-like domain-containing protein 4A-chloroplastic [Striga hermonthica]|uniref:Rhodanese-like domain-containing protein 4A-chloroplastic n=1 Tax=Striga hermonthica TaxID=68872 RepID=A0A9N7NMM6_STRHE|nr:Rhodanese-like domain-containing protein 4A-chloroplastic [Striga hermonthica]
MESLSSCLSVSPPLLNPPKTPKSHLLLPNYNPKIISFRGSSPTNETQTLIHKSINISNPTGICPNYFQNYLSFLKPHQLFLKPHFSFPFFGLFSPFSCLASESAVLPDEGVSNRISLESVVVAVDNFFIRYPFFVATVTFVWLVVIPLTEEYMQKYKFISAINAFKKLQDDPACQLLDIRDGKSLAVLRSPNLKILRKSVARVEFREGDEDGFVKRVLKIFEEPSDTIVCILDNFDGNSFKAAELLVKNGFKEAYAIRGGILGQQGWQDIQETLLPPSVHIYPTKKSKKQKKLDTNGGMTTQQDGNDDAFSINKVLDAENTVNVNETESEDVTLSSPSVESNIGQRPLSPYPNYPDFRPPSSPTPSKPK